MEVKHSLVAIGYALAALPTACGTAQETATERTSMREQSPAREQTQHPREREKQRSTSPKPCETVVALKDPPGDAGPWSAPPATDPHPRSGDLRRFELGADETGVCARWTTAAPALEGTEFVLSAHGPPIAMAGGASISHGHGFEVELRRDSGRVTFGIDRTDSHAPRVLRAQVRRVGRTVSAFVPRAELDRPPANVPDRPPFPYRGFSFEARVITPPVAGGGQLADVLPEVEAQGDHALINARLCEAPCVRFLQPR